MNAVTIANGRRYSDANLHVEVRNDDTHCTVRQDADDKPVATLQRRRAYETGPVWRLFTTKGREIVMPRHATPLTALRMIAKVRELNPNL